MKIALQRPWMSDGRSQAHFINPHAPSTISHLMDPARIAELLRPFLSPLHSEKPPTLTGEQLRNISTYIDLLSHWNTRINLTSIREPEEIVTRHFGESLFAACRLFAPSVEASGLIDVGSGAGFPGVPIKLWAPKIRVTLIESNQKKVAFLREVVRALTLTDINVFASRAEDFSEPRAAAVTLRAVERFDAILPIAARLLAPAGRLALLIGESQIPRARQLLPSFEWDDPAPIPLSSTRVLLVARRGALV